jgi:LPS sulfotransferase NodH
MTLKFKPGGRFHFLISAESDLPPTPIRLRYFVFSQQRTGSTLLTEALVETKQAGVPIEYFNPDVGLDFWERIGNGEKWRVKPYFDFIEKYRVTANGVFGFKSHMSQLTWFIKEPERQVRFTARFDRVILNYRRDKIAQAVSFERALAGGPWFVTTSRERRPVRAEELSLAKTKIIATARNFVKQEKRQRDLIRQAGVPMLDLPYERLDEDFVGAMREVLAFLDLPASLADDLKPPLQKLRDEASREIVDQVVAALSDDERKQLQPT